MLRSSKWRLFFTILVLSCCLFYFHPNKPSISLRDFFQPSSSNYSVVIARYNENLTWLDNEASNLSLDYVYIYNKNNKKYKPEKYKNNIILPNLGRESHTFLTHIVEHYDKLTEYVIFATPDWPNCNFATYPSSILGFMDLCNKVTNFVEARYYLSNDCGFSVCKVWRQSVYKGEQKMNTEDLGFGYWMDKYIEPELDTYINKTTGILVNFQGTFCVRRENILSRPKEFYAKFIPQLDHQNHELGHFFERSWFYMFNIHKLNPKKHWKEYIVQPVRFEGWIGFNDKEIKGMVE